MKNSFAFDCMQEQLAMTFQKSREPQPKNGPYEFKVLSDSSKDRFEMSPDLFSLSEKENAISNQLPKNSFSIGSIPEKILTAQKAEISPKKQKQSPFIENTKGLIDLTEETDRNRTVKVPKNVAAQLRTKTPRKYVKGPVFLTREVREHYRYFENCPSKYMYWTEIKEDVMEILLSIGGENFFEEAPKQTIRKSKRKRKMNKRYFCDSQSHSESEGSDSEKTIMVRTRKSVMDKKSKLEDLDSSENNLVEKNDAEKDGISKYKALKGSRVRISKRSFKSDKVHKALIKYDRMEGIIERIPVYPGTWFSVRMTDDDIIKCRSSSFKVVEERNEVSESLVKKQKRLEI